MTAGFNHRDAFIDFLRGTAMLFVILGHYATGIIRTIIFTFHIPLFLFISGYLYNDKRSLKETMQILIVKMMPSYVATVSVLVCIDVVVAGGYCDRLKASLFVLPNADMGKFFLDIHSGIGPLWYLPSCILATFCSILLIKKFKDRMQLAIAISILISLLAEMIGRSVILPFGIDNGLTLTSFFVFGYWLRGKDFFNAVKLKHFQVVATFVVFVGLGFVFKKIGIQSFASRIYPAFPISYILTAAMLLGYLVLARELYRKFGHFKSLVGPIASVGKHTLAIMCVHTIEFEFLVDRVRLTQLTNIAQLDYLLYGIASCMIYTIAAVFIDILSQRHDSNFKQ